MGQRLTALVTGISGQLGHGLVAAAERAGVDLVPMARAVGRLSAGDRLRRTFPEHPELAAAAVTGDVAAPAWGLSEKDLERLAPEIDIVLNVAAETNWSASKRRLQAVNVLGALHGLDVARALQARHPRCGAYVYGSSIYVAGGAVGRIPETLLGPRQDRTAYEHSKWLAERHLAHRAGEHSMSIGLARVGGLLGDSSTGSSAKRNSLYLVADLAQTGRGWLPVTPGGRVDMLPRDMAAAALLDAAGATLRLASPEAQVVHVCAGERAPTLAAVLATLDSVGVECPRARTFPAPERVVFEISTRLPELLRLKQRAHNQVEGMRYLCLDRVFERDRLARFLPEPPPEPTADLLARLAFGAPQRTASRREPGHAFARFV